MTFQQFKAQAKYFWPIWAAGLFIVLIFNSIMYMATHLPEWDVVESTPSKVEVLSVSGSKYGYINYRIPGSTETYAQRVSGKYAIIRFRTVKFPVVVETARVKYKLRDSNPAVYDIAYPDLARKLEAFIP